MVNQVIRLTRFRDAPGNLLHHPRKVDGVVPYCGLRFSYSTLSTTGQAGWGPIATKSVFQGSCQDPDGASYISSMKTRAAIWNAIKADPACDVLILGGGVNGAGLLRDLALQAVRCILVDKDDYAAGTARNRRA